MVSDALYSLCLPILSDESLDEEDKTDALETLLREQDPPLVGRALEDAILTILWRHRDATLPAPPPPTSPPPSVRHPFGPGGSASSARRVGSPAPWQMMTGRASTPTAASSPSFIAASPVGSAYGGVALGGGMMGGFREAAVPPALTRAKSGNTVSGSPFTSPRPSPRLAFTSPIPHSPSLSTYEFVSGRESAGGMGMDLGGEYYGDYGSDTVDWLVGDDSPTGPLGSRPTSSGAGSSVAFDSAGMGASAATVLSGAAPVWVQPQGSGSVQMQGQAQGQQQQQMEMSPYDMLRSVLGESKTDEEIEQALEQNNYDLSATIAAFMSGGQGFDEQQAQGQAVIQGSDGQVLIGKSMLPLSQPIPINNNGSSNAQQGNGQGRSNVICKYWLATGSCLRADCRFSHDFGSHVCKYWLMGNCLAGETCVFSHDPTNLMASLNIGSGNNVDSSGNNQPSFQVQDYDFPALQSALSQQMAQYQLSSQSYGSNSSARALGGSSLSHVYNSSPRSYGSRPTSRHSSRAPTPSIPAVDDNEAFPSLGTANVKAGKKHHGKRGGHGHGHQNKENVPGSMADVVRMSPGPTPGALRKNLMKSRSYTGNKETTAAANAIPTPEHIPWLETGEKANQAYIKARQDAFKHGGLRNKFLQSAAQAWNRSDARAAKALSLRGQSENDLMRKAHREAARHLYESRTKPSDTATDTSSTANNDNNDNEDSTKTSSDNPSTSPNELYVDLHGLHPEEAVSYLARIMREQRTSIRPVYAITGTGHHSKGGKDKVGKAVRMWLGGRGIAFREFSVPGDRGNVGGILGIDARTGDLGPGNASGSGNGGGEEKERDESVDGAAEKEKGDTDDEKDGGKLVRESQNLRAERLGDAAGKKPAMVIPKGPRIKA